MKALERREAGEWRRIELQLDTAQIVLVIASLLGLCAASFYLGRWMERDRWQEMSGKGSASGVRAGQQETVSDLTFFDTLGSRPATEPERQEPRGREPEDDDHREQRCGGSGGRSPEPNIVAEGRVHPHGHLIGVGRKTWHRSFEGNWSQRAFTTRVCGCVAQPAQRCQTVS